MRQANGWRRPGLAALGVVAASCGAPPSEPVVAPASFAAMSGHVAGTLLEGVPALGAATEGAAPPASLEVRERLLLVDRMERVEQVARDAAIPVLAIVDELSLVARLGSAEPLGATSRLVAGGGVVRGEPATRLYAALAASGDGGAIELDRRGDVVVAGVSTVLRAWSADGRLAVALLGSDATRAEVSLEIGAEHVTGEIVKVAQPLAVDASPLLLILPSPFGDGSRRACALLLELAAPPAGEPELGRHVAAVEEALAQARSSAAVAAATPAERDREPVTESALVADALRHVSRDPASRPTLVALAIRAKTPLLGDLSLSCSDEELAALLERLEGAREKLLALAGKPADLLFGLEREAFGFLAARGYANELSQELSALAFRHAGAVASWPVTLDDLVARCSDAAGLEQAILDENRHLLENRDAAVRVRAFDWLAGRGLAPPGFDPLASLQERRAALAGGKQP
jgi:hypothetical protein